MTHYLDFKKKEKRGFSLIELIAFIIVLGILGNALLVGINTAQKNSDTPRKSTEASFLANARMQIILMNSELVGYTGLNDPCTPPITTNIICQPLADYALANNFTSVSASFSVTNPSTLITVSVSGAGSATTNASVYNYANN